MIFIHLILITSVQGIITNINPIKYESLANKLREIHHQHDETKYQERLTVFIINDQEDDVGGSLLRHINRKENQKVIVLNIRSEGGISSINGGQKFDFINYIYLFLEASVKILDETLNVVEKNPVWKPTAKIIIVLQKEVQQYIVEDFFRYIWERKMLNVIIVQWVNEDVQILGFNPYFSDYFQKLKVRNAFYDKTKNMNGYTFNVILTRTEDFTKVWVKDVGNNILYLGTYT